MENIAKFLEGCERLGCPKHDLFQTIDLYENKNPGQVVDAIWSLSRHAAKAGCDTPVCAVFFFLMSEEIDSFERRKKTHGELMILLSPPFLSISTYLDLGTQIV